MDNLQIKLSKYGLRAGLVVGIIFFVLHMGVYFHKNAGQPPMLADPDCYLWMLRSEQIEEHFSWYSQHLIRSNFPLGEPLSHWSPWVDMSLYLPAKALSLFLPFKTALLYWGIIYSPLILLALFALMGWLCGLVFKKRDIVAFALFFFALQAGPHVACAAGRPDNHSILLLFFLLSIGGIVRSFVEYSRGWLLLAAASAALALEISIQSLSFVGVIYLLAYVAWGFRLRESFHQLRLVVHAIPAFALAIFLVSRAPARWNEITLDQLCWLHTLFMVIPSLVIEMMYRWEARAAWHRWLLPPMLGGLLLVPFYMAFPIFFHGPMGQIDSEVRRIWIPRIMEMAPLVSSTEIRWPEMILTVVAAIPCTLISLALSFNKALGEKKRIVWMFCFLLIVIHAGLTIAQYRWVYYVGIVLVLPYAAGYEMFTRTFADLLKRKLLCRVAAKVVFLFLFTSLALLSPLNDKASKIGETESLFSKKSVAIPFSSFCEWLDKHYPAQQHVVSCMNTSMEILYRTHHTVVGTPYHRNKDGILDNYHLLTSTDDATALEIIKKWNLTLIIVSPADSAEQSFYKTKLDDTLYKKLLDSKPPAWLRPAQLPEQLEKDYLVYEVALP